MNIIEQIIAQTDNVQSKQISTQDDSFLQDLQQANFKKLIRGTHSTNTKSYRLFNLILKFLLKQSCHVSSETPNEISHFYHQIKNNITSLIFDNSNDFIVNQIPKNQDLVDTLFLMAFYSLFAIFIKESWTGKSCLYADSEKKIKHLANEKLHTVKSEENFIQFIDIITELSLFQCPQEEYSNEFIIQQEIDLNRYNYQFIKQKSFVHQFHFSYLPFLNVGGEIWSRLMPYSHIFIVLNNVIDILCEHSKLISVPLWKSRASFMHNQVLQTPVALLCKSALENYGIFIKFIQTQHSNSMINSQVMSNFCVEFANCLIFYYKYKQSEKYYLLSQHLLMISASFTGRIGVRTKYQTFKIPQLVVNVQQLQNQDNKKQEKQTVQCQTQSFDYEEESLQEASQIVEQQITSDVTSSSKPVHINLDDDCILYDGPQLDKEQEEDKENKDYDENDLKQNLTVFDQISLLGKLQHMYKSNPKEELLREQISAYLDIILKESLNWLVYSQSLLQRSLNEFPKWKTKERSVLQLQALSDQFNLKDPPFAERFRFLFCLNYPSHLDMQKVLGQKMMDMGSVLTSCEIFKQLDMAEECVECLAIAGHRDRAAIFIEDIFQKAGYKQNQISVHILEDKSNEENALKITPKLICLYGDIKQDFTQYKISWKMSNKKFARAQRSLANYYFYHKDMNRCVKAYNKALEINSYHAQSWFTLGCAYMQLKNYAKAATAFSSVVQIDETQGEAWANLSSAFIGLGKKKEALSTLEQAVKYNESSWKMWQNLLFISLENRQFAKYLDCIRRILSLQQKQIIDNEVISKMNVIFKYHTENYDKLPMQNVEFISKKVQTVFELLHKELSDLPETWNNYSEFLILKLNFVSQQSTQRIKSLQLQSNTDLIIQNEESSGSTKVTFDQSCQNNINIQEKITLEQQKFESTIFSIKQELADTRLKACHCIMITGYEAIPAQCEKLIIAIQKLIQSYEIFQDEEHRTKLKLFIESVVPKIEHCLDRKINI